MAKLIAPHDLTAHPRLGGTDILPALSDAERKALKESIRDFGIMQPIVVAWPDRVILDGHHRWKIARELGLSEVPIVTEEFKPEPEQFRLGVELNAHRRHLTTEQKRVAIAALLREDPKQSNRSVAETVGVSDKTVGSVRSDMEGRAEIPHVDTVTDSLGREQPATKPRPPLAGNPATDKPNPSPDVAEPIAPAPESGERTDGAPEPSPAEESLIQNRQARTQRGNGYSHIAKLVYFADTIRSDKNVEHAASLLVDYQHEFYEDQRYRVEDVIAAGETVLERLPAFLAAIQAKLEDKRGSEAA